MADTYEGYCVKCKEKREYTGEVRVSDSGRRMARGTCPVCGTTINRNVDTWLYGLNGRWQPNSKLTLILDAYRSTFVIGADGNVTSVMHDVKPATHADDVLAALGS